MLFCGLLGSPFLLGLWFEVASSTACGRRCAPGGPFARARLALKQDILTVLRLSSSSYWQNKSMLNVLFVLISERMVPDPYFFPFLRVLLFRRQAFVKGKSRCENRWFIVNVALNEVKEMGSDWFIP